MRYWKYREEEIGTLITLLSFFEISHWKITMNNSKKETKTIGPKHILLMLKKSPGNRHNIITAMEPVSTNREIKVVDDRKLIKINSKDGRDIFSKEMHNNFEEFDTGDSPKFTKVSETNEQIFVNMKKYSIFDNNTLYSTKSGFCRTFNEILYERRKGLNIKVPLETNQEDSKSTNLVSTSNKQDRFVPNILRNTKTAENTLNNSNNQIETHSLQDQATRRTDRNIKRKRKQVLNSLDVELDLNRSEQIVRKKNQFNGPLLHIENCKSSKESKLKTSRVTRIKSEPKEKNDCAEMIVERVGSEEAQKPENLNPYDLCLAEVKIPYEIHNSPNSKQEEMNSIDDKSVKNILAEFEVADYKNYIASEDLGFYINEMDKLLNSDTDGSLTNSSVFDNDTRIAECDVNGNDIDNYRNAEKKKNDKNNVQCKIEPCYNGETKQRIPSSERLKCDLGSNTICPGLGCGGRCYRMFKPNSWPTEFEDDCSSDDFPKLHHTPHQNFSSTDTASETESNGHYSEQSASRVLPKTKEIGSLGTFLTVTDVVPDNVLDNNSNRCCPNSSESEDDDDDDLAKRFLDSCPMMQQCHPSSTDFNDTGYSTSSPGLPLEKHKNSSKIDDEFNSNFGLFFQDGNFLRDDMLSIDCVVSREDETCERILANSNAKFDSNNFFNGISDLDIENVDDIEISRLLRSGNVYNSPTVSDATLQLCVTDDSDEELGIDTDNHIDKNDISISDNDNTQFGWIKFEDSGEVQVDRVLKSSHFNGKEDLTFSFENDIGSGKQRCETTNEDFQCSNSSLGHASPKSKELALPCSGKAKDGGGKRSSGRSSPPLTIQERENINELATSKLETLLRQAPACREYSSYTENDSKISDPKHCSEILRDPGTRTFDSTFSSCTELHRHTVTGCDNFHEKLYSHASQEKNITAQETSSNLDNDYSIAEIRYNHPIQLNSQSVQDPGDSQRISCSECSMKPASTGRLPDNLKKRKIDIWKGLVKRSKRLTQNISYIPCDFCEKKYRSQAAVADHIKYTHHYKPSRDRYKEKKYVCDKCSKEYCLPGAIEKHFKLHENYVLTCRICEKHFTEKIFLRRHVYSEHLHWDVECSYCSRKFSRQNSLTSHLKKCHGLTKCWPETSL